MGRKITDIQVNLQRDEVQIRGLSKSPRGSKFILRATKPVPKPKEKEELKKVLVEQIELLLKDPE